MLDKTGERPADGLVAFEARTATECRDLHALSVDCDFPVSELEAAVGRIPVTELAEDLPVADVRDTTEACHAAGDSFAVLALLRPLAVSERRGAEPGRDHPASFALRDDGIPDALL